MMEKMLKMAKRSNKRKGRNITIGAVIGFLLSCTVVMGADEGLEIEWQSGGNITVNKEYEENVKQNNSYTNNTILIHTSNDGNLWSIIIIENKDAEKVDFINNGYIKYKNEDSKKVNGIQIESGSYGNLINNGKIDVETNSTEYYKAAGIGMSNVNAPKVLNNGYIKSSQYGIYANGKVEELVNTGLIYGGGSGISSANGENIKNMVNKGRITGAASIYVAYNSNAIEKVENIGIFSGGNIFETSSGGKAGTADNYGLMIGNNLGENAVNSGIMNYGLAVKFNESDGTYTALKDTIETPEGSLYTVKNIELKDGKQLDSLYLKGEKNDSYVYNGLENTLIVSKENNELANSVVNAHKTALVMQGSENELVLDNTQVNGGLDEISSTVVLEGDWNNLNAKNESVINGNIDSKGNFAVINVEDSSVVNGDIKLEGKWNTLTLDNSIVNGEITALGTKNTLNLYGKSNLARDGIGDTLNINHNINGFGRVQIKNNVIFSKDIKVSGAERVNIVDGGVLSLGLNESGSNAAHALNGNTGLLISGENIDGILKFLVGGLSENTVNVDMEGITLENIILKTSNVVYKIDNVEEDNIQIVKNSGLDEVLSGEGTTLDQYSIPADAGYNSLNNIYKSVMSNKNNTGNIIEIIDSSTGEEQIEKLLSYLGSIYTETPYSFSSELSRKSMGMFRDIITENQFKPNLNQWMIMGGLTHADGGAKDTYYGQNYHVIDTGTADTDVDMKLTGAYALGKYGYSENLSLGVTAGGNRSEAELSMSKVKGNSGYIGAFAENYRGSLTLKAGAGIQYSEYDADRRTIGGHSYNEKYSDMAYDIYLNGRYSNPIGDNLFLEPYGTLSYTYIKQDGADEGSKVLAIETDSKSFSYTTAKVGVDLKKIIPHEKGKSTLSAGVSYTRLLNGADEENITGRFKGGSDFDILVPHKNEHSIGLNAKYTLELENGILFDVKGSYNVERDSHNGTGKNKAKGEWIVGAGLGYKF